MTVIIPFAAMFNIQSGTEMNAFRNLHKKKYFESMAETRSAIMC